MRNTLILIFAFTIFAGRASAQCNVKITDPAPVCFPATVNLTSAAITAGSDPGLLYTYWTDALATNPYLQYTAATAGTYYIKGDNGIDCFQIQPVVVTVTIPPTAAISYAGNPFCRSGSGSHPVTITGTGAYTGGVYSSTAGLSINASNGSITARTSTAGTYTVTYTIPASGGCPAFPVTTSVTILALPAAPIVGTIIQPTCTISTGSVELSGLPTTGTWTLISNPAGITLTGNTGTRTVSPLTAATTYTFTVTNSDLCVSPPSDNIPIIAQPALPTAPVVGAITEPSCSVATGSVFLSGLPAGSWTVRRTPGNVDTPGNTQTATISGIPQGTFNFSVRTSSNCVSPTSDDVLIPGPPPGLTAPVVGLVRQPECAVSTGSVTLTGLPSTGTWTLTRTPDGVQRTGSGASFTITGLPNNTIYTFSVSSATACASPYSGDVNIRDQPETPIAPRIVRIIAPTCTLATGSVIFTDLPATGIWTLIRYPGAVETTGTGISDTITGIPSGTTYIYSVKNADGCTSPLSADVVIPAPPPVPSAPVIGTITQPVFSVPTGSVVLNGLPSGSWVLTRLPDNVTTNGATTSYTVSGLPGGAYTFTVRNSSSCTSVPSPEVRISTPGPPNLVITDPPAVCFPATVNLQDSAIFEGSTGGLVYTYWTDTLATTAYPTPATAVAGKYFIKGTTVSGYSTIKPVIATTVMMAVANAGADQILANDYSTTLDGQLDDGETGIWSVISGTGVISDTLDPKSEISKLSSGNNILSWKVTNGVCPADSDKITITVGDIIIPTLITPNGDPKNEYFVILGIETIGKVEIVIFDRRGSLVYRNIEYDNKWNGVDHNEKPLPNDTYFYHINTSTGRSLSGYIVVRR